jgi:phage terminase large subunit-like protein
VQTTLLGEIEYQGSMKRVDGCGRDPAREDRHGPASSLGSRALQDLVDTVKIKHVSGGWSKLGLKSYQQGRGSFEGTAQHVVWDDEEPPEEVYGEQMIRTATTGGILMLTFTPLEGMSEVVQRFLPGMGIEE